MIEVIVMAFPIFVSLRVARGNLGQVRMIWRSARWYEKLGLGLMFVPIPGPVDEIVAALIVRRVTQRVKGARA